MSEHVTRRAALLLVAGAAVGLPKGSRAADRLVTVHKNPDCDCCTGWVGHLQKAGFATRVFETADLDQIKTRLGVPAELAACHTAEVAGYVVEGHVPAVALKRLLAETPPATGSAVPGMPLGSPGMGGKPEKYDVILFGPQDRRIYMSFVGEQSV